MTAVAAVGVDRGLSFSASRAVCDGVVLLSASNADRLFSFASAARARLPAAAVLSPRDHLLLVDAAPAEVVARF